MLVKCAIEETDLDGDNLEPVAGLLAECSRCGTTAEAYGTGIASARRCLAQLRENCPNGERNYYLESGEAR